MNDNLELNPPTLSSQVESGRSEDRESYESGPLMDWQRAKQLTQARAATLDILAPDLALDLHNCRRILYGGRTETTGQARCAGTSFSCKRAGCPSCDLALERRRSVELGRFHELLGAGAGRAWFLTLKCDRGATWENMQSCFGRWRSRVAVKRILARGYLRGIHINSGLCSWHYHLVVSDMSESELGDLQKAWSDCVGRQEGVGRPGFHGSVVRRFVDSCIYISRRGGRGDLVKLTGKQFIRYGNMVHGRRLFSAHGAWAGTWQEAIKQVKEEREKVRREWSWEYCDKAAAYVRGEIMARRREEEHQREREREESERLQLHGTERGDSLFKSCQASFDFSLSSSVGNGETLSAGERIAQRLRREGHLGVNSPVRRL